MEDKPKHSERRRASRFTVSLPVTYSISVPTFKKQLTIKGVTKDVSTGGAAIVASHMPTASVINLQIGLPQEGESGKTAELIFISPKVRIAYSRPVSKQDNDIYRSGVCFVEICKRDLVLLRRSLNQYNRSR